jgi:hypothetical protein
MTHNNKDTATTTTTDIVSQMILDYESGQMDYDQTVSFFQQLVDSGMAWQLQGNYGRMAQRLINAGEVTVS